MRRQIFMPLRKAAAVFFSVSMVMTAVNPVFAAHKAESSRNSASVQTEVQADETAPDSGVVSERPGAGYISDCFSERREMVQEDSSQSDGLVMASVKTLPESYKTASLPAIRNQGGYGVCWAFSTIACVEINLLKKGYAAPDLSELHLAYFANHSAVDPLGGLEGDDYTYTDSDVDFMQRGGNYSLALNALADWLGAAKEETAPYDTADTVIANGLSKELAFQDAAHLQGYQDMDMTDMLAVKAAIMEYGAVGISYYAYTDYYSNQYYNAATAGYYCYDEVSTNHAVTVVGWDDAYPAADFPTAPEGDGAWIVRNSWGTGYGENGYFYLSYYDKSISGSAVAFDAEPADNYDNNYQYDGSQLATMISMGTIKAANVFQAKANADGAEQIAGASFEVWGAAISYTAKLYTNLADIKDPESGVLSAQVQGTYTSRSRDNIMKTVSFEEPVYIEEGVLFSIVVELEPQVDSVYIYCDRAVEGGSSITNSTALPNQSYLYFNGRWQDYGAEENTNFRIKAYTNNTAKKEDIPCESVKLNKNTLELAWQETEKLTAEVLPYDATNRELEWSSSDPSVATVSSDGTVTGVGPGTAVITVQTVDKTVSDSCTVTVKKHLTALKIQGDSQIYAGASGQLTVDYTPLDTTDDTTVIWTSFNAEIVTVDAAGKITGIRPGKGVIRAEMAGLSADYEIEVLEVKEPDIPEQPRNGWYEENGVKYWYEDDVKQGLEGRGKEIYDPESNAWYWLDAEFGGRMAVSKDVYQESFAGEYADREDGTGKWVRYDENGHMIKGEHYQNGAWYRFDETTGAMVKGWYADYYYDYGTGKKVYGAVDINGKPCAFDDNTGHAVDRKWYTIDGIEYWYEDGVRQGLEGRGKEIYDTESRAWYWLDSVDNGKKAVSKDVYQESYAGEYAENEDGTGKWVRYDADGHMIKGWDTKNGKTYYFDLQTGAMVKGTVVIEGVAYLFDGTTGVLQ